ncbi:type II toxin-antitoxin system VapC family toxin [Candidatus Gottesmanbacteria bacterium]|nr:type II toxin-antitoxin system VapC family toxin [Candidatus Gottesmanbacteria bacterium]
MTTFLIDSDVIVDFFQKKSHALRLIEELCHIGNLAISLLTISELRAGWTKHQADFFLPQLYNLVKPYGLTETIAELSGELRYAYKIKGVRLPTVDTLIAATAIINDLTLVTRNNKDYPMPELHLYSFPSSN